MSIPERFTLDPNDVLDTAKNAPGYVEYGADSTVLRRGNHALHVYYTNRIEHSQVILLKGAVEATAKIIDGHKFSLGWGRQVVTEVVPIQQIFVHDGRTVTVSKFIEETRVIDIEPPKTRHMLIDMLGQLNLKVWRRASYNGIDIAPMNARVLVPSFLKSGRLYITDICAGLNELDLK